jgi:hypothetical protein
MAIKLYSIYSSELLLGSKFLPEDPTNCWVKIIANIGLDGGEDQCHSFNFNICTPKYLENYLHSKDSYWEGKGVIIISIFDWTLIKLSIESIIKKVNKRNWSEIVKELSKYSANNNN